jgi:hypothetical protein
MAFLDNSGDIILDAVLTDLGRERLSRSDGSFKIEKFALGDDEISYTLYDKNHPSGSAYYDIEIMQTPVLEAFTNNASSMKSKLISLGRTNILYLPVLAVAQAAQQREAFYSGSYVVAVDENTQGNGTSTTNAIDMNTAGFFHGASGFANDKDPVTIDQGLNTTEISNRQTLDSYLVETSYMIEIDNRFGSIVDPQGSPATLSYVDDDNIATYLLNTGTNRSFFESIKDVAILCAVAGPRGTRLVFKIASSVDLAASDFLFDRLGSTTSLPAFGGSGTVSNVKFIDSNIRITGVTTGYRLDIPIRFVKSPS